MHQPLVSALMVTGKPGRQHLVKAAIRSFLAQTYENKELIIVNDGPEPLTLDDDEFRTNAQIKEIFLPGGRNLGDLRNVAVDNAAGDWCIQWDDDDWYGPDRMTVQMADYEYDQPTLLNWQIRYSFVNDSAYAIRWTGKIPGIPGTVCFPRHAIVTEVPVPFQNLPNNLHVRKSCSPYRYRSEARHEDSHFLLDHFPKTTIIDNAPGKTPGPELYMRFYHGANTWDHKHIMQRYADPDMYGVWHLSEDEKFVLSSVLTNQYGVVHTRCH